MKRALVQALISTFIFFSSSQTCFASSFYRGNVSIGSASFEAGLTLFENVGVLDGGAQLWIAYKQNPNSNLKLCHTSNVGTSPTTAVVQFEFLVGNQKYYFPGEINCVSRTGVKPGHPKFEHIYDGFSPYLYFSLFQSKEQLNAPNSKWNKIFPKNAQGNRWYALKVAVKIQGQAEDSNFGNYYPMILDPVALDPFQP